jgi:hypothetical protein
VLSRSTDSQFFNGMIAEACVWSVGLTDDEILMLANGAHPWAIHPLNIVGYWPVWGTVSPEPDWSGANNHMTLVGALAADHPPKISLWQQPRRVLAVTAAAAAESAPYQPWLLRAPIQAQ